jgi:RNA polymerase sigma factor (sigma-70 family)
MPSLAEIDLEQLNRKYRPALMAFFLRRLGNRAEAEDMTQDVFARLATGHSGPIESSQAYLFQMAANLLRDRGRREKVRADYRANVGSMDGVGIETLEPARIQAGRETLAAVTAGLRELQEPTRSIFILYRLENVDKRNLAEAYSLSLSSIDRHLMKAMGHLIECARKGE